MLERVDRVQLAVRNRTEAAATFAAILDARIVGEDAVRALAARRTTLQAGESEFELLEPTGDGPVARHLERWGEGIFAAGFSTADVPALARRLRQHGIRFQEEGGQLYIPPEETRGMRAVISPTVRRSPTGLITWLYEVTHIVEDHQEAARFYAGIFGLDPARFAPIHSQEFGYTGTLTLFNPPARLDRIELTQITDPSSAMGRFFAKRGPSIYMCFAEAPDADPIRRRLEARGARYANQGADGQGIFIHPSALHGMFLGVSLTNRAWLWSGHPELAGGPS
jgi:catechol 2,3-dioxygenase-like lactoylglutathione lyase family enzyme